MAVVAVVLAAHAALLFVCGMTSWERAHVNILPACVFSWVVLSAGPHRRGGVDWTVRAEVLLLTNISVLTILCVCWQGTVLAHQQCSHVPRLFQKRTVWAAMLWANLVMVALVSTPGHGIVIGLATTLAFLTRCMWVITYSRFTPNEREWHFTTMRTVATVSFALATAAVIWPLAPDMPGLWCNVAVAMELLGCTTLLVARTELRTAHGVDVCGSSRKALLLGIVCCVGLLPCSRSVKCITSCTYTQPCHNRASLPNSTP